MARVVFVLIFVVSIGCSAMPTNERIVRKAEYGEAWPFTMDEGTLACVEGSAVILRAPGGEYALNGRARGLGRWAEPDAIWRTGELMPGDYTPLARMPEPERRAYFAASVECEDRGDTAGQYASEKLEEQAAAAGRVSNLCKADLQRAHGLSDAEVQQISAEGGSKGWPPLAPHRMGNMNEIIADGLKLCED